MARHSRQVPISTRNSRAARSAHARASQEFRTYDTSAIRPKRSKVPLIALAVIVVCLIIIISCFVRACSAPKETLPESSEVIVVIEPGEGARNIANTLYDNSLIQNADQFISMVNDREVANALIPGTYLFHGGMSQQEILEALLTGPASTADSLTVPEGFTRANVASAVSVATNGRISEQDFLNASADAAVYAPEFPFLASAGNNSLEGYLFPKTYSITATDDATGVVKMMLTQFQSETAALDWSVPEDAGLTQYEAVTLASIVQKEGIVSNYTTIASVFYNRLKSKRPYLESDATTAYEVGHDPTPEEVHADSPYSTYSNEGLPPTPICNPSLEAMHAVCEPDYTSYMYFFSHDDGTYEFSVTYEQHQSTYQ